MKVVQVAPGNQTSNSVCQLTASVCALRLQATYLISNTMTDIKDANETTPNSGKRMSNILWVKLRRKSRLLTLPSPEIDGTSQVHL